MFVQLQHLAEVTHASCTDGSNRASADGVDADVFRAQFAGNVLDAAFESRLADAHEVVARNDFFTAVVGESQNAAAVWHDFASTLGHSQQTVRANFHGQLVAVSAGVVRRAG